MRFRGWVPNIVGHISFSLIGTPRQPRHCQLTNFPSRKQGSGRMWRIILCRQRRNLSDNLFFSRLDFLAPGLSHSFDFTVISRSGYKETENVGFISGWIFLHRTLGPWGKLRAKLPGASRIPLGPLLTQLQLRSGNVLELLRSQRQSLLQDADFAVAFRLSRTGAATFIVPQSLQDQDVRIADGVSIPTEDALRTLTAQCFYFLRDITHRHYHHNARSDTITSVWSDNNKGRWIRETLYELYKRVILARGVKYPSAQENALGILAYADAFEREIAGPFRDLPQHSRFYVPKYENAEIKASIGAALEAKRRLRTQKNVAAAAIPAITISVLVMSNAVFAGGNSSGPISTLIDSLKSNEWYVVAIFVGAVYWVLSLTEILPPPQHLWPVKQIAQLFSTKGRLSAIVMTTISVAIIWLISAALAL